MDLPGPLYPYREELHHPALLEPSVSRGVLEIGPDGALIRRQSAPRRETVEIRGDYIHVLKSAVGPEAPEERQVMPVPDRLSPLLTALRAIIARETPDAADAVLTAESAGWRLDVPAPGAVLRLLGCGGALRAVELAPDEGARRKIIFAPR
ncbi:MAG: hypothetical protein ACK5MQ_14940 [Pikeienuella sp.]